MSNHSSPVIGVLGAEVPEEFSNNFTKFSLSLSPQPLKLLPIKVKLVEVVLTVPSVMLVNTFPSVLLIV